MDTTASSHYAYRWLKKYPKDVPWDSALKIAPVYSFIDETAALHPQNPAIHFLGKTITYQELALLINKVAKGLQEYGVVKGDKIGLFMPNCPYFIIMYYAIQKAGAIVVNYNPLYAERELMNQIEDSQTEMMVTLDLKVMTDKILPLLEKTALKKIVICSLGDALPLHKRILLNIFKRKDLFFSKSSLNLINYKDLIHNDGNFTPPEIDPLLDIAVLQYTGGTTGIPKGAMLTHANISTNAMQAFLWFKPIGEGPHKVLAALPLFHVFAMTAVMNLAIVGGHQIVILFPRFSVEEAINLISKHKITFFPAVPTIYNMINHHPDVKNFDLSSLKACLSGGAGLPNEVKIEFEKLTGARVVEAYGLSETSPAAASNPLTGENKIGSIGVPFPGTYIRIVSLINSDEEVPINEKGQIAIKGPQVMLGYWNRLEETQNSFNKDGFFLTGDIGYMDEDGYTFLVDRIKDLIICSGFNVYPRIIEEAIYTHQAVEEVTVIGIPDEKRGETVKAFIKLKVGQLCSEEEILLFLKDKISPIEMPKVIEFKNELPKTMIGKLSKKELIAEEKQRQKNKTSA